MGPLVGTMDIRSYDILLVGGGGAGLRAAIAATEVNPTLSIAVVSKVYPMRSHTVSAEGGAAGVARPDESLDEHCYDTIAGGDWMCDQDAVEAFVKEAPLGMDLAAKLRPFAGFGPHAARAHLSLHPVFVAAVSLGSQFPLRSL